MVIEEALYAYLASGGTAAGSRIYPNVVPEGAARPAVAYQKISGVRDLAHDGSLAQAEARFQFTCIADTYPAAKQLTNQVRVLLHGFSGLMGGMGGVQVGYCSIENELDGYNQTSGEQVVRLDALIAHTE